MALAGFARLGVITELLSKPLRVGYLNGVAVVVVVSQLPKLFGFSVEADATPARLWEFLAGVADGLTNWYALAIGIACLALLFAFKHWAPKFPGVLVAFVGATLVVAILGLTANGVPVVGPVPQGFPTPALPSFPTDDLWRLTLAAFGMAFITLADTSALSRTFALKYGRDVDPNQEIVALGTANLAAGFFQGFPVSGSASRTAVAEAAGGRSQLVGVVGAAAIAVLLLFAGGLTTYLPQASLAAIVIVAGTSLFDIRTMRWLWKVRRTEFALCLAAILGVAVMGVLQGIVIAIVLSIAAFLGVAFLGVLPGVFLAVALSLLNFVRRLWRPHDAVLGRAPGVKGYHDIGDFTEARQVPGLMLFRFDAPLFFANGEMFRRRILDLVEAADPPVRRVVVAAEPITDVDTTAIDPLCRLVDDLAEQGIDFGLAELKHPVREHLEDYGLIERLGEDRLYPTLGSAVHAFVRDYEAEWVDWEDSVEAEEAIEAAEADAEEPDS